jgi:hypothetical protein
MKARVSQLHRTESEWNKLPNFVPLAGEFIVFDTDEQHPYVRLKIGDGELQADGTIKGTKLKDLPFFINATINECLTATRFNDKIDCGRITDYKN